MVLEENASSSGVAADSSPRMAPVSDRVLAFFLDTVLFVPIFSIVLSPILKQIEYRYFVSPKSVELFILLGLAALGYFVLGVLTQSLFITNWAATPGKHFLKLRVQSLSGNRITFLQALLRSLSWGLELFLGGIAFFEVLSHPERRPIHDRISETFVVTRKNEGSLAPLPMESHFFRHLYASLLFVGFAWVALLATGLYRTADKGEAKKFELIRSQYLCDHLDPESEAKFQRVDIALAKLIANETDSKCALAEADFALWTNETESKSWAYLLKGFYNRFDKKVAKSYFDKSCEASSAHLACRLSDYFLGKADLPKQEASVTLSVLLVLQQAEASESAQVFKSIDAFPIKQEFSSFLQAQAIRSYWIRSQRKTAIGAFKIGANFLNPVVQEDLARWLCFEQLEDSCANYSYSSCDLLRASQVSGNLNSSLALVRERECKGASQASYLIDLEGEQELAELMPLVQKKAFDGSISEALSRLGKSRLSEESKHRLLLWTLQKQSLVKKDIAEISEFLAQSRYRGWIWKKTLQASIERSKELGSRELLAELESLQPTIRTSDPRRVPAQVQGGQ